jgi:hypothetical protein
LTVRAPWVILLGTEVIEAGSVLMDEQLQGLLLNLNGIAETEAMKQVQEEYLKLCLSSFWQTHDSQKVTFYERQFAVFGKASGCQECF